MSDNCKQFFRKQRKDRDIAYELGHKESSSVIFKLTKDGNRENCYSYEKTSDFGWCPTGNETVSTEFTFMPSMIILNSRKTVGASAAIIAFWMEPDLATN